MEDRIFKILAIDDNPDNLLTLQALISEVFPSARIVKALNGMHGLELASTENPDVILLDILMPDMDGFEVCQRLKADKNLLDIPVVFVTSLNSDKETRIKGLEVGADAFLGKPIDQSELVAQIRAMVKIRDVNTQRYDENIRLAALVEERTRELKQTNSATLNLLEDLKTEIEVRKKTEKALRESEALYRAILEVSPDNIIISDTRGKIEMISPSGLERYGFENENQLIGKSISAFIKDEDKVKIKSSIYRMTKGLKTGPMEYKSIKADGSTIDIEVNGGIMRDTQGGISKIVLIARDITERKQSQEALEKSEAKYREFVENSPEAIAIYSDGIVNYVNQECVRLMKASTKENLIGMPVIEFIHPDNRQAVIQRMQQIATNDANISMQAVEEKYIRLDGTPIFVEVKAMPMIMDDKPSVQLTARDISDRKLVENELERSRIELKTIYDYAPVMMCVVNADKQIQFVNNAFETLTGVSEADLKGSTVGTVIGCIKSLDKPQGCGNVGKCTTCGLRKAMGDTLATGKGHQNIEFQSVMNNGDVSREVYLLGSTSLISTPDQKSILLCLHDITDRKLAEDALQKSEALLRTFIDNSPFEIWARDNEGVGILENKKVVDHYGSILGHTPQSGSKVELGVQQVWLRNNALAFAGTTVDEEDEFVINNQMRIFQQIIFPIKNLSKIIGIAGFNIDITERKLAEKTLTESQEQLKKFAAHLQNVREEERVVLAREIHDELGQILIAIKIDMGMLKQNVMKAIDEEHSKEVLIKFDNLVNLVNNTIKTARKIMTDLRPEVLELLGFAEAVKLYVKNFQDRYRVTCQFVNSVRYLDLNSQHSVALFRIIQEALNNVAKHAQATVVIIELSQKEARLVLEIMDNGIGFDENKKKNTDSYGLIGMKERVFLFDGELSITSKIGQGTKIRIEMPYLKADETPGQMLP